MEQDRFYSSIANHYEHIFPVNPQQVEFILQELSSQEEFHFLDAGCSIGLLAHQLANRGAMGIGIDLNADMIRRATSLFSSNSLSFRKMDMLRLNEAFPEHYFDAIICFGNTIVHLDNLPQVKDFLKQTAALLKPGGKLMLQLLNYDYIINQNITQLPIIENEQVRFVRKYNLPDSKQPKITFTTELTLKDSGETWTNSTKLLPLRKNELHKILLLSGFNQLNFYGGFDKSPFGGNHLPLIVVAQH